MRKFPIYILIDSSESMQGKQIILIRNSLSMLVNAMKNNLQCLETVYLSVITFGGNVKQVSSLTDLISFQEPQLIAGGSRVLGAGLKLLCDKLDSEVRKPMGNEKGDWKPYIFLFIGGVPADNWKKGIEEIRKRNADLFVCTAGFNDNEDFLKQLTDNYIIDLQVVSKNDFDAFFHFTDTDVDFSILSKKCDTGRQERLPDPNLLAVRKLPIYFVLDVSETMKGEPIEALNNGLSLFANALRGEPQALETAYLSVITFGDIVQQIFPLTDLESFQVPHLRAGGSRVLGAALELLDERLKVEVKKPTIDEKGDWKPIIFLFTDGIPSDNWQNGANEIKKQDVTVVACALGFNADLNLLKQITENVIELKSASKYDIAKYFRWDTQNLMESEMSPLEPEAKTQKVLPDSNLRPIRRLPIYLLLDTAESIQGEQLEALNDGIIQFVSDLRKDPFSIEHAYLSIITCGDTVKQLVPLTEILSFKPPALDVEGSKHFREGLDVLSHKVEVDVIKGTAEVKGDYNPICFLLTDEIIGQDHQIKDNWKKPIENLTDKGIDVLSCPFSCYENMGEYYRQVIYPWRDEPRTVDQLFYQIPVSSAVDQQEENEPSDIMSKTVLTPIQESSTSKGKIKTAINSDGETIEYINEVIGYSSLMDVYFTNDKKQVVAFYKRPTDEYTLIQKHRLEEFIDKNSPLSDPDSGEYWKNIFYFPEKCVSDGENYGFLAKRYPDYFFFEANQMKGKAKEGKWFVNSKLRRLLDPSERGTWPNYFQIAILLSRAVRRMHTSGLAHSDLSYKNVLIDPKGGHVAITGFDCLVVIGKYPPDVLGTPDFIAPEVYKTIKLDLKDKNRILPSRRTDLHALAVLIYMYLLYRHPLRGGKVHDLDPGKDEELSMSEKALFIEHPTDKSNRPKEKDSAFMPWADVNQIPYTVTGPYLKELFDRAFIDGLHNPARRPIAGDWEKALVKTIDLMQPCGNAKCEQKWFVFDNTSRPRCPFCGWKFTGLLPILNFYSSRKQGHFNSDNHRLMVYHNQFLYPWHVNKRIFPNERLSENDKKPVGYFSFFKGKWVFVNQNVPNMKDLTEDKDIPIESMVELKNGKQILLSQYDERRLVFVQMVKA